ncbi:MAG TPA: transglutaminase-like domain-containing protein [Longimicrobiales bacterium]|mgnify:CR=1 FL=1|nr:transglutaminase-like domain-containing protein [Longimicrobiales bacterium]
MNESTPSIRERFAALASAPESELDLATGALLIAAEEYPQLQLGPYLRQLDLLAERVHDRLGDETAPLVIFQELNRVLFEEEGFRGNIEAYYDVRNSFLNDVLDRRLGIPITLSVVYLEVGWRLGLPLVGVGFPGHFLVRYEGEALRILVDPFECGRIRFEDQAQELLDRVYGGMVRMQPEYLRSVGKKDILVRLLMNLKGIYLNARDDRRALSVIDRILLLRPGAAGEMRDRGLLLARIGRVEEAIAELERYLDASPGAPDAWRVREVIAALNRGELRPS